MLPMSIWVFWFVFCYYTKVTHFFLLILGRRKNFKIVDQHNCSRHTGKVCPNCRLVRRSLQTLLSYLSIFCRMSEKNLHREVAGLIQQGRSQTLHLSYRTWTASDSLAEGRFQTCSDTTASSSCRTSLLPAAAYLAFSPEQQMPHTATVCMSGSQCFGKTHSFQRGVTLTCSCICSKTQSQGKKKRKSRNMCTIHTPCFL